MSEIQILGLTAMSQFVYGRFSFGVVTMFCLSYVLSM